CFKESLQRFIDREHAEVGPHQIIKLSQSWIFRGILGCKGVLGARRLDIAAHFGQSVILGTAMLRKLLEERIATLDELSCFGLRCRKLLGAAFSIEPIA